MLKQTTLLLLLIFTTTVFGATINFPPSGQPIIGSPFEYQVFGVQLTQPTLINPNWILQIETNYPGTITGNTIPPVAYGGPTTFFSIGDFLIIWNGVDYGVVLAPHVKVSLTPVDGYTAGNLYQTSGFQNSGSIMGADSPNPPFPIWINPGATQIGTGNVTVATTGDGLSAAKYTITAAFTAPPDFLGTGPFQISFSSYSCGNGVLTGSFDPGSGVPEPATLFLIGPALLLLIAISRRVVSQTSN
jgi:hypothetical protein